MPAVAGFGARTGLAWSAVPPAVRGHRPGRRPHRRVAPVVTVLVLAASVLAPAASAAPEGPGPEVVVRGGGFGHSVGMSQYGAFALAKAGRGYADILRHYYPGVAVGHDRRVPGEIRVGLLADQSTILVRTSSRDGQAPARSVTVDLGNGAVDVPWTAAGPFDYAVSFEGGRFVLKDENGAVKGEGPGPVTVGYEYLDGNPTLLRLPQLLPAADQRATEAALAGAGKRGATFQWGRLEVAHTGGDRVRAVMVLSMQRYLRGLAEMPSSWHPEALRAQAVAGRTYATRRVLGIDAGAEPCGCHLGATPVHQFYTGWSKEGEPGFGGAWVAAVDGTDGVVATSGGDFAQTVYSSSHGGRSENSQDSWAFSGPLPYLVSVDDGWSLDPAVRNPFGAWAATFEPRRFLDVVAPDIAHVTGVRVVGERTAGGTPRELEITGWDGGGQRTSRRYTGPKGIAGAGLKVAFPPDLRSQQIRTLGFPPFADDEGSVHEYNIWAIATRGITAGCDGGNAERYCPNDTITRGQMATLLAKALGLAIGGAGDRFDDTGDSVHRGAIAAIAERGITTGCAERRFCPGETVTRGQMATFLAKAFTLPSGDASPFADAADSVHAPGIAAVAKAGITSGCAADRYCPSGPVIRSQMATFLSRALNFGW